MTRVVLVRHGRTTANATGILAGRAPNVHLDDRGISQARQAGRLLSSLPSAYLVASPLTRTIETAKLIRPELAGKPTISKDKGFIECDYGDWSGKSLKRLAKDPLWPVVQSHPAGVIFPHGEAMAAAQSRAVAATRSWVQRCRQTTDGPSAVIVVSHGDVIKSIIADALGMHLDSFQRIVVDPGSISVIDYTPGRPFVRLVNGVSDLSALISGGVAHGSDAAVGGGAGKRKQRK